MLKKHDGNETSLAQLGPFIRPRDPQEWGMIVLTPPEARELVRKYGFEKQRLADAKHVGALAEMMLRGAWRDLSLLTFVITVHGEVKLVDAQHRLLAQGSLPDDFRPFRWLVRVLVGEDPRITYAYLDSYQKQRSPAVLARSLSFAGLSDAGLSMCVATAERVLFYDTEHEPSERMRRRVALADKVGYIDAHLPAFRHVDTLLQSVVSSKLRRRLYGGRIQAVMVATVASCGETGRQVLAGLHRGADGSASRRRRSAAWRAAAQRPSLVPHAPDGGRLEQLLLERRSQACGRHDERRAHSLHVAGHPGRPVSSRWPRTDCLRALEVALLPAEERAEWDDGDGLCFRCGTHPSTRFLRRRRPAPAPASGSIPAGSAARKSVGREASSVQARGIGGSRLPTFRTTTAIAVCASIAAAPPGFRSTSRRGRMRVRWPRSSIPPSPDCLPMSTALAAILAGSLSASGIRVAGFCRAAITAVAAAVFALAPRAGGANE